MAFMVVLSGILFLLSFLFCLPFGSLWDGFGGVDDGLKKEMMLLVKRMMEDLVNIFVLDKKEYRTIHRQCDKV
ncbi:hypothetical protein RJT34_06676 [Clitoria ternatea]|uniref:Uncharacterized protein n=1 Tax=Clitoria ternatea TaxID=43366 RepID=A0AAN9K4D1_CLITE